MRTFFSTRPPGSGPAPFHLPHNTVAPRASVPSPSGDPARLNSYFTARRSRLAPHPHPEAAVGRRRGPYHLDAKASPPLVTTQVRTRTISTVAHHGSASLRYATPDTASSTLASSRGPPPHSAAQHPPGKRRADDTPTRWHTSPSPWRNGRSGGPHRHHLGTAGARRPGAAVCSSASSSSARDARPSTIFTTNNQQRRRGPAQPFTSSTSVVVVPHRTSPTSPRGAATRRGA
jgi:hypothetical protein